MQLFKTLIGSAIVLSLLGCGKEPAAPNEPTIGTDRTAIQFGGEFGNGVFIGTAPQESLLIQNEGLQPLVIERVEQAGDEAFALEMPSSLTVEPLGHTFLRVIFSPTDDVEYGGTLTIYSNAENEPQKVISLSGRGIAP